MQTNKISRGRSWIGTLKVGALGLIAGLGLVVFASTQSAPPAAQATPDGLVVLNSALCTALGTAFGGIPAVTAAGDCNAFASQPAFQEYTHCLLKEVVSGCTGVAGPAPTGLAHPTAATFKALDLDKNQVHLGQALFVIAFVNDDFPVRFTTDVGTFVDIEAPGVDLGQNFECNTGDDDSILKGRGDPDCDSDPATVGDGVVVAKLLMNDVEFRGTGHVNVEQENVIFPDTFTVVGPPEEITLTPLFGKDTISTGATPPTLAGENALSTDCNFSATADGVLGANGQAEKVVVVAKALDNEGNAVVGALLDWNHPITPTSQKVTGEPLAQPVGPTKQAGVALPQTPTLDTGPLGIAFPQFVCGLDEAGDFTVDVGLDPVLDSVSNQEPGYSTHKSITIHVINPADRISMSADPASIDCNGTNTSKVTANVANVDGQPVANGLDINFSVVALGTANPLKADSAAGAGSTTVSPLSGAGTLTTDGGPTGVTVTATVAGARSHTILKSPLNIKDPYKRDPTDPKGVRYDLGTQTMVQSSILVQCTGGSLVGAPPPPPPAPVIADNGGGAAGAGGRVGTISGPDTGSGGFAGSTNLGWAPVLALAFAALTLGALGFAARRSE